jgi:hypothetical protein
MLQTSINFYYLVFYNHKKDFIIKTIKVLRKLRFAEFLN